MRDDPRRDEPGRRTGSDLGRDWGRGWGTASPSGTDRSRGPDETRERNEADLASPAGPSVTRGCCRTGARNHLPRVARKLPPF